MERSITHNGHGKIGLNRILSNNPPDEYQAIIAASGISPRLWRLYANFWLICLLFPILALIQSPPMGWRLIFAIVGLALFAVVYFWVMWPHPTRGRSLARISQKRAILLLLGLSLLVFWLTFAYGSAFLWLLVGVSAIAGITLSFRGASLAVIVFTLLTLAAGLLTSGSLALPVWLQILPLVLLVRGLGLDMIGFVRLSDALRELHYARQELARQAVTEERLRMARDLHDLLGHTLSLITLKSELAGRLAEKDPLAAAREIHDVEQVARQALREVREAVAGYRQESLESELEGARQLLAAAGINCSIEYPDQSLPPAILTTLAWVVREGVTNIIRHSHARQCRIRIQTTQTTASVEIQNDGYPEEKSLVKTPGSGLAGLSERVEERGGHLESGPLPFQDRPGFHLRAEFPLQGFSSQEAL